MLTMMGPAIGANEGIALCVFARQIDDAVRRGVDDDEKHLAVGIGHQIGHADTHILKVDLAFGILDDFLGKVFTGHVDEVDHVPQFGVVGIVDGGFDKGHKIAVRTIGHEAVAAAQLEIVDIVARTVCHKVHAAPLFRANQSREHARLARTRYAEEVDVGGVGQTLQVGRRGERHVVDGGRLADELNDMGINHARSDEVLFGNDAAIQIALHVDRLERTGVALHQTDDFLLFLCQEIAGLVGVGRRGVLAQKVYKIFGIGRETGTLPSGISLHSRLGFGGMDRSRKALGIVFEIIVLGLGQLPQQFLGF